MVNRVVFLCEHNTVRSPMAALLLGRKENPARENSPASIESAGLHAGESVDPFACAVMAETGCDLTAHIPKAVDWAALGPETLVIALSADAFGSARQFREKQGFELDYWALPALPSPDNGRDTILEGYRAILAALRAHIGNRFANR